jgi:hypothetical protein
MYRSGCYSVFCYYFGLLVYFNMILVPVMSLFIFCNPAGIYIFLRFHMFVLFLIPFFRYFSFLYLFVFFFCITLTRRFYKCGIYNASAVGYYFFFFQLGVKHNEYFIKNISCFQFFSKIPYSLCVGYCIMHFQHKKSSKT